MIEGKLKYVIKQFDSVLPIFLKSVIAIKLFEFIIVRSEVFTRHNFTQHYLLEFMILYLNP